MNSEDLDNTWSETSNLEVMDNKKGKLNANAPKFMVGGGGTKTSRSNMRSAYSSTGSDSVTKQVDSEKEEERSKHLWSSSAVSMEALKNHFYNNKNEGHNRVAIDSPNRFRPSYESIQSPYMSPSQVSTISPSPRHSPYYQVEYDSPVAEISSIYHKMGNYANSPRHEGNGYMPVPYATAPMTPKSGNMGANKSPAATRRTMEPVDGYIYQVQFKRAHRNFILAPSAPRNIIPGDFVKVEADRGEDMGIVLSKLPACEFEEVMPTAGYRGRGFASGQGERKFLYRVATPDERVALATKVEDEEIALQVIREKVAERALPMAILDAEYQFDRHKLTFFFEAERRIDFRELVSELFSQYKTRIWMQQVDTSVLDYHDAGTELAKATGFLPPRDEQQFSVGGQHSRSNSGFGQDQFTSSFASPVFGGGADSGGFISPIVSGNNAFSYPKGSTLPANFQQKPAVNPYLYKSKPDDQGESVGQEDEMCPLLDAPWNFDQT